MIPGFKGIFRDDNDACAVYSEAAGIARILPRGIAVPTDADDVSTLIRWAHETNTPLIPRGSGSSMSGGAIGDGIIVDLSRMRWIDPVDVTRKRVRVGPGAIRNNIDAAARAVGLRFPIDPSSGKFCTIGGMISTNAAGSHTLKFGPMRLWITALDCVFEDGTQATITRGGPLPTDIPALHRLQQCSAELREQDSHHPIKHENLRKDSSGYDLHTYLNSGDLIDLLVGSEGTLVLITGAELALTEIAGATSSLLATFTSLDTATDAAGQARDAGVAACELLDQTFLEIVSRKTPLPHIPSGTEAVLLAEVEGIDATDAQRQATILNEIFQTSGATTVRVALNPVEETEVWELRHAASPTLATLGPSLTSMQFIEDGAVPPERFPEYVRGVRSILQKNNIPGVIFGHAGDAHAHVNPLIDTSAPGWRDLVANILDEVVSLSAQLGGTLAGEHGDGRLRTPLLSRVWPQEALHAFHTVKNAFDPIGILNPGVKVPLPNQHAIDQIKYDPALPPLPARAQAALAQVTRDRAYDKFRLDLLDQAS